MERVYLENLSKMKDRGGRWQSNRAQATMATDELVMFVHRVALNEKASKAELRALPEIAALVLVHGRLSHRENNEEMENDFGRWRSSKKQASAVMEDLVSFIQRVAPNKNASPAELEALPEIAGLVLIHGEQCV